MPNPESALSSLRNGGCKVLYFHYVHLDYGPTEAWLLDMILDNDFQINISVLNKQMCFQILLYFKCISVLFSFNHTASLIKEYVLVSGDSTYALQDK